MHDGWLMERDAKMPQVILNDKLMTDALLSGGQPIKTEHSYSLKSDGDSMPDSPCSLHDDDKMDDDDGKCSWWWWCKLNVKLNIFFNSDNKL